MPKFDCWSGNSMAVMVAMQFDGPHTDLRRVERPIPRPGAGQLLIGVIDFGVCRTDLPVADGEIPARYPIIPGPEIVGHVLEIGADVEGFHIRKRVAVPRSEECRVGKNGENEG